MTLAFVPFVSDVALRRGASVASMGVALALIVAKTLAYAVTDSVALLSSLIDSGIDLFASAITAYGVVVALRPADRDHRFGHGKAEALAAMGQAIFILLSAAFLLKEAVHRFFVPAPLAHLDVGYQVMGFGVFLTLGLLLFQTYAIRRTGSLAITSDRLHYVGDVLVNLAVMASFALGSWLHALWIDPLFAAFAALLMVLGAGKILKRCLPILMDAELPEKERAVILAGVSSVEGVRGVHDLRTRFAGDKPVVELHVEMAPSLSLRQAHKIVDAVTARIAQDFPKADVLIHQDPAGLEEDRLDAVIERNEKAGETP